MYLFNLPYTTTVNRVIPKNAFDEYANTKQRRLFTDQVSRVIWTHKISPDTVNLEAREIKEIQVFEIELKFREDIKTILDIIDKAIPYHIIFIPAFNGEAYISLSVKHPHPVDENHTVIDWTFRSEWFSLGEKKYAIQLKRSIDAVFHDLCIQISGDVNFSNRPVMELVVYKKKVAALEKEIYDINLRMANCRQFNEKVKLNLLLLEKQATLADIRIGRSEK